MRLAALRAGRLRIAATGFLDLAGVALRLLRGFLVFLVAFRFRRFVPRLGFLEPFRLRCLRRRLAALFVVLFFARLALRLRCLGDETFLLPISFRTNVFGDFFAILPSRQARPMARMTSVRELLDTCFVRTK